MISSIDSPTCKHGWALFNPNPCPECSPPEDAPVTAPVTDDAEDDPYAHLDIPGFLQRNPDNTLKHPGVLGGYLAAPYGNKLPPSDETPPTLERQPTTQEALAAHKKLKARARIAKMKAVQADRAAVKDGKVWDTKTARWV